MTHVDEPQGTLPLVTKRELILIDERTIANQRSALSAFNLMPNSHGLSADTICYEIGMDKAQWSKVGSGSAHFPMNKLNALMDTTGSIAFLQYLLYSRGYESVPRRRKSQVELENDQLRKELEEERMKNKWAMGMLKNV